MKKTWASVATAAAAIAIAIAVSTWHFMRDGPTRVPQTTVSSPSTTAVIAGVPTSTEAPKGQPTPVSSTASAPGLFRQMQTAADLRVFAEAAKRSPGAGGVLYATSAVAECRLLRNAVSSAETNAALRRDLVSKSDEHSRQRLASLDWLEERCVGFSTEELGRSDLVFMLEWGGSKDPLLALKQQVRQSGNLDATKRAELVDSLLATSDPLLLDGVRGASSVRDASSDLGSAEYLDGVKFGGLDAEGYIYAWDLAICAVAQSCSSDYNANLRSNCALGDECYASEQARVRSASGSDDRYQRIATVSQRLVQVVQQRNSVALRPPTTP